MNKYTIEGKKTLNNLKHILKIMRITLFLLFLCVFFSQAAGSYSQETTFTMSVKATSIKEICEELENTSNYRFIFAGNAKTIINKRVDLTANSENIEEILQSILSSTGLSYRILENQVVIYQDDLQTTSKEIEKVISDLTVQQQSTVRGKVVDQEGEPLPGVTITIEGTPRGVITDIDGTYSITADPSDKLVFSFVGMENQVVEVGNQTTINIELFEKVDELDEVTVVAFGRQKKESVVSAIETISTDDLRIPTSNLTTAFAGRMAGMISYQTSGEPGQDNAQFFIRGVTTFGAGKVDPLILIDNVEVSVNDMSRYHPDDIASFSILKDATATALYGARGANGVILITTKEGREGEVKVSARYESSISSPTKKIEMADPLTYMRLANEAAKTRDPLASIPYSDEKIHNTELGRNPLVYPSVDWMDMLFDETAMSQRVNLNISGGGRVAQYYIAGSFSHDEGIFKTDKRTDFDNNINLKKYLVRSNINIHLTPSTESIIRVHGTFEDYNGPTSGGSDLYRKSLRVSPVRFPAYYEPDRNFSHAKHILFGGYDEGRYLNPYADMVSGFRQSSTSVMMAQFELKQDFGQWVDGLNARFLGNTTRNAYFDVRRSFNPFYYNIANYNRMTDEYSLIELNPEGGTNFLSWNPGSKSVSNSFYGEASVSYNNTFNEKNDISGMLIYMIRQALDGNSTSLTASLPKRNLGLSGRFTYGYDSRYLFEFNFGYNGSEKFDRGHRWGFFPSIGLGWIASNESFWSDNIANIIPKLKLRGSYGLVGNDEIGGERFFYLSRVNMNGGGSYRFGYDFNGLSRNGVSIGNYENPMIGWEIAKKTNLGFELGLFDGKIDIIADLFSEIRTNILQTRADIPTTMGLWSTPQTNVGEASGEGVDLSIDYTQAFNNDLWIIGRGNFTFARSTYKYYEEPDFSHVPWRSRIDRPISQRWGYVAERLFIDEADVAKSARQDFGEYSAGDIKYKDMNNDGVINELDLAPIGYPNMPEINYGFGLSAGYKSFDFSFFFQGSGRSSFWIDAASLSPFIQSTSDGRILETGLAKFIADDYWSETSQNPLAGWPRLSNYRIDNNIQRSTWFMANGRFLRFKSAELGYSLPHELIKTLNLSLCRIYVSGTNLFLWSDFNLWDVEMGGNGLGYPLQRVINLGVNISF